MRMIKKKKIPHVFQAFLDRLNLHAINSSYIFFNLTKFYENNSITINYKWQIFRISVNICSHSPSKIGEEKFGKHTLECNRCFDSLVECHWKYGKANKWLRSRKHPASKRKIDSELSVSVVYLSSHPVYILKKTKIKW